MCRNVRAPASPAAKQMIVQWRKNAFHIIEIIWNSYYELLRGLIVANVQICIYNTHDRRAFAGIWQVCAYANQQQQHDFNINTLFVSSRIKLWISVAWMACNRREISIIPIYRITMRIVDHRRFSGPPTGRLVAGRVCSSSFTLKFQYSHNRIELLLPRIKWTVCHNAIYGQR